MTTKLSSPRAILDPQIVAEQLAKITLSAGGHHSAVSGMCIMEAVSYIAGEQFSFQPECACPVITAFMITFNDTLPDNAARDRWIKPLIPALAGSRVLRADGTEDANVLMRRSLIAGNAALRYFVPVTLDIAAQSFAEYSSETWAKNGAKFFTARAAALRALPEQTSFESLALAAHTVFADCADIAACVDITGRTDLYALGDLSALGDFYALTVRATRAATSATHIARDIFGDLARATAFTAHTNFSDHTAFDQINEARVATVLEMLAVQGANGSNRRNKA